MHVQYTCMHTQYTCMHVACTGMYSIVIAVTIGQAYQASNVPIKNNLMQ